MMGASFMFQRICIIGIGLIGSSLARGIRHYNLAHKLIVCDASEYHLNQAQKLELADEYTADLSEAVKGADLIILATPVGTYGDIAEAIAPFVAKGAIVSDVGSVKKPMITDVMPKFSDDVIVIPAHPLAGTENSGPQAGFYELFEDRWCVLCPLEKYEKEHEYVEKLSKFWRSLKSFVAVMDVKRHDEVLAITSHLPHLIAWTIVGTAADMEKRTKEDVIRFSAAGFRDFTRIAASDPVMWRDVFLTNKDAVLEMLGRFTEDLSMLQRAIRDGDSDYLEQHFIRGRTIRRGVIDAGQQLPEDQKIRHDD